MVWNQYVLEASTGNEAEWSDDENDGHNTEYLHIDDWIDFNSDEIDYAWAVLREYLDDAGSRICPSMTYEDFARFCHEPPEPTEMSVFEEEYWVDTHSEELSYMWKILKRTKSSFLFRTTYEMFTQFCCTRR
jgi:hypothetical protein